MQRFQKQVNDIDTFIANKTNKQQTSYAKATMLAGEVGELCDELVALEGDRVEDINFNDKSEIAKELVDVIYNTLRIANHYNIDLDEYWDKRLQKIKSKFE